jgi:TolB-like protein/two-component SAPR family response regulator/Tfp pilus assembly protein PilF
MYLSAQKKTKSCIPTLEIRLLGRFEVLRDGKLIPEEAWGRRKTKTLLKVLLTDPGRVFTQDQLIDALFDGENVNKALENLYGRVSQLRRALEPDLKRGVDSAFIIRGGQGYSFNLTACGDLDTEAFRQGLDDSELLAEEKDWTAAVERFEEAVTLYRGEFLAEDRYEDWAEETRTQLRQQYIDAMTQLAEFYERLGRLRQAISYCQRVLALEPHRESVIQRLMEYQTQAGQRDVALDTYTKGERALRDHLDVEPSAGMQALRDELTRDASEEVRHLDPRRIAVLPLVSYSPHPEDAYFADGMTEELIASLSKIKDFRVVARTSVARYHGTTKPITQISRELGVGTILEGSVRKAAAKVRITAQLIDGVTEDHLWAEHYNFDIGDILEVQTEIARRVSEALKLELLSGEEVALRDAGGGDSEAHIAYMKGKHFLSKSAREAIETAIHYFEQALLRDPRHARAQAGLADAYCRMVEYTTADEGYTKARAHAEKGLEIDDSLAEVHTSLAAIVRGYDGNVEECEQLLRHAIQLNPNYAPAHAALADLLMTTDRADEAIEAGKLGLALDPLSVPLIVNYALCLYASARFHEAIEQGRKALELDPEHTGAWWVFWYSRAATWDWDSAEDAVRQNVARHPESPAALMNLATCVMCRGRLEEGIIAVENALAIPGAAESTTILFFAGVHYYFAREYNQALTYFGEVLERDPTLNAARIVRSNCYFMQGRLDECLEEMDSAEKAFQGSDAFWHVYVRANRGKIYAMRGDVKKAEEELDALINGTGRLNRRIAASFVLAALGRVDEAILWLEAAVDAREPHIVCFRKSPLTAPEVSQHPRFQALLKRIGLAT